LSLKSDFAIALPMAPFSYTHGLKSFIIQFALPEQETRVLAHDENRLRLTMANLLIDDEKGLTQNQHGLIQVEKGLIDDEKVRLGRQHMERCFLCEHRCGANRLQGERGPCKAGVDARVFRHRVEVGEELELVPSHLFYLSGCDLRCCFCIAEENAWNPLVGTPLNADFLCTAITQGQCMGARNIQWVGGEPTIHLPAILAAMADCPKLPPVVWKSDFYGTPEAWQLLAGVVHTYVADFKFGNNPCALRLAKVDNYVETVTRNLKCVAAQGNLIVRHLLLPGHQECCYRPIVQWLAKHLPKAKFSIRDGYLPRWQADRYHEISRPMEAQEIHQARRIADKWGLNVIV
jgi:putative pyruvate formate lyase activating enzyme